MLLRGLLHVKELACHARYASTAAIVASKLAVTRLLDASDAVLMMSKLYFPYSLRYLLFPLLPVVSLRTGYVICYLAPESCKRPEKNVYGCCCPTCSSSNATLTVFAIELLNYLKPDT